jgi:hypothetical protein
MFDSGGLKSQFRHAQSRVLWGTFSLLCPVVSVIFTYVFFSLDIDSPPQMKPEDEIYCCHEVGILQSNPKLIYLIVLPSIAGLYLSFRLHLVSSNLNNVGLYGLIANLLYILLMLPRI